MNIRGDDVVAVMKYMQATPWASIGERRIDIKNNNLAVLTIHNCPTLSAIEKEGTGREKLICEDLTTSLFSKIAHYFNPKIKVTRTQGAAPQELQRLLLPVGVQTLDQIRPYGIPAPVKSLLAHG